MNDRRKTKAQLIEELAELRQKVEQLQSIEQAEVMLQKRATALETVAQVSTAASTLLDTDKLLHEVVNLTKEGFNLYHAHIYLLAEDEQTLILTAGAGAAGRQMVAEGWHIPLGHDHSLVARAARTRQGVIVNDVRQEPDFLPNPLLPATRSELAVPLITGEQVLGVLDVQADVTDYFSDEDIYIQMTLAGQIAAALRNATLYEQVQQALTRQKSLADQLNEQHATLEKIAENVPGMIYQFVLHPDGQAEFPYVSSGSRQVYGLEPDVIINDSRAILDIVHAEDVGAFQQTIAESARTLQKWAWEGRVILPSGQMKWISGSSMPEKLDNGDILWSGVVLDINERKRVEAMLAKRAVELETAAQVGVAASTILNVDKLLQRVVDLTKERFNLYHAHIYLLDEVGEMLDLAAGAGEVGREMVAQGWQIPIKQEQSLVAGVARHKQGVIVNDVRATPDWLPNPLLPETRSELAVPMIVGQEVVGVLDIQADQVDYFADEDIRIQTTLAGQVAVALQNARLFAKSQHQAERERLINQVTQKIQGTVTVESALQMAVKELGHALQARQTRIELIAKQEEESERLSIHNGDAQGE